MVKRDDRQPDLIEHMEKTIKGLERRIEEEEAKQAKLIEEQDLTLLLANCLQALRLVPTNVSISEQFRVKGVKTGLKAELEKRKSA
jgi:hypothetical protein